MVWYHFGQANHYPSISSESVEISIETIVSCAWIQLIISRLESRHCCAGYVTPVTVPTLKNIHIYIFLNEDTYVLFSMNEFD